MTPRWPHLRTKIKQTKKWFIIFTYFIDLVWISYLYKQHMHLNMLENKLNLQCTGQFVCVPELLASGKTELSLRLYCSVRLATLYTLSFLEKLSSSAWPGPNTATNHDELPSVPHELAVVSTAAESGRETCAVLWGETKDTAGVHKKTRSITSAWKFGNQIVAVTYRAVGGVVCDGEWGRKLSLDAGGVPFFYLESNSLNATWRGEHNIETESNKTHLYTEN